MTELMKRLVIAFSGMFVVVVWVVIAFDKHPKPVAILACCVSALFLGAGIAFRLSQWEDSQS